MKNIHICGSGRFGNFIIQIQNAIQIALFYNYNVILPIHKYINTTYIVINNNINLNNERITDKSNFYYYNEIENIDLNLFKLNIEKANQILKNCLTLKNESPLGVNDLLIHIRSGDIFEPIPPHGGYIMPPLSYYVNIINNNKFDEIYLVAEDRLNPCINSLLELYPKIKFNLQSLDKDIELILGATNVVMSYGTFIPSLLIFSKNIKNLYKPSYFICPYCVRNTEISKVHNIDLTEYAQKLTPWKNLPEQLNIMITYK